MLLNIHRESQDDYFLSALNWKETVAADGYFVPACRFNQLKSCTSDQALACHLANKSSRNFVAWTSWNFPSFASGHGLPVFHRVFVSGVHATFLSPKRYRDRSAASALTPKEACCRSSGTEQQKLDRNVTMIKQAPIN